MRNFLLFILALVASALFIRWRGRVATQKLLEQPMPEVDIELPQHPDGILLLFHHPRCGPCKQVVNQMQQIAAKAPDRVLNINVGEQMEQAQAFGIRATPTTIFIKNNTINAAFTGPISLRKLQALLNLNT